jgi:D-serine deaminase-like pyridoxal phosphate-dependent protein
MGYEGHLQALPASVGKDHAVLAVGKSLAESRALIESDGIPVEIVSSSGTGTYYISAVYPGITEIQAGSYLLMDMLYVERGSAFTPSLTVLATVISRPEPRRAVVDCGVKALSGERGLSTIKGIEGVEMKALHAVHAPLEIHNAQACLEVGQKIEFWVRYSDATVNLHDRMYGIRQGEVEEVFHIER